MMLYFNQSDKNSNIILNYYDIIKHEFLKLKGLKEHASFLQSKKEKSEQ